MKSNTKEKVIERKSNRKEFRGETERKSNSKNEQHKEKKGFERKKE